MRHITCKLGNMRKAKEWTVYPYNDGQTTVLIQCDTRIARINLTTKTAVLSANRSGGAYGIHLSMPGAEVVAVPQEVIDAALAAQPRSGDEIGPGVYVA